MSIFTGILMLLVIWLGKYVIDDKLGYANYELQKVVKYIAWFLTAAVIIIVIITIIVGLLTNAVDTYGAY